MYLQSSRFVADSMRSAAVDCDVFDAVVATDTEIVDVGVELNSKTLGTTIRKSFRLKTKTTFLDL